MLNHTTQVYTKKNAGYTLGNSMQHVHEKVFNTK